MEANIQIFDIPTDFIAGDNITGDMLNRYVRFSCKMKAVLFAFCVEGSVHATINLSEYTIKKDDFIILFRTFNRLFHNRIYFHQL